MGFARPACGERRRYNSVQVKYEGMILNERRVRAGNQIYLLTW